MSKPVSMQERARRAIAQDRAAVGGAPATRNGEVGNLATVHQLPAADIPPVLPEEFWNARPMFLHIRQAAHSRLIAPDGVFASALVRAATCMDWRMYLPAIVGRPQPLNLFAGLVAGPGGGKGASLDAAAELLPFVESFSHKVREISAGSGEGIVKKFFARGEIMNETTGKIAAGDWEQRYQGVMVRVDEGSMFGPLMKRQGQTTTETLRSGWSGETLGGSYADEDRGQRLERMSYRLCMVMGIQPEVAGFLFDDVYGGLPQRFVWLPVQATEMPDLDNIPRHPGSLGWTPPSFSGNCEDSQTGDNRQQILVAPAIVREIQARHIEQQMGRGVIDPMNTHGNLAKLKVAAVLGGMDRRASINAEDWEIAGLIMETSMAVRRWMQHKVEISEADERRTRNAQHAERAIFVEEVVDDARTKRLAKRLYRYTRDAAMTKAAEGQPERAAWRDLANRFKSSERDNLTPALELALESDWVRRDGDFFVLGDSQPQ